MSLEKINNLERQLSYLHKMYLNKNNQNINLKVQCNNLNIINNSLKNDVDILKNDVEFFKKKYECCVCMNNPKNVILEPCYHFSICEECLKNFDKCPICRKNIELYYKIY